MVNELLVGFPMSDDGTQVVWDNRLLVHESYDLGFEFRQYDYGLLNLAASDFEWGVVINYSNNL